MAVTVEEMMASGELLLAVHVEDALAREPVAMLAAAQRAQRAKAMRATLETPTQWGAVSAPAEEEITT